jgi:hypothetical protein
MAKIKANSVRINIYAHDPEIRRQIKTRAAQEDLSISEYCLQAISNQLARDRDSLGEERKGIVGSAVEKALRFHTRNFGKRAFSLNSAVLIKEARRERSPL